MKLRRGKEGRESTVARAWADGKFLYPDFLSQGDSQCRAPQHPSTRIDVSVLLQTKAAALRVETGLSVDWAKDPVVWPPIVNNDVTMMEMMKCSFCPLGSVPIVEGQRQK